MVLFFSAEPPPGKSIRISFRLGCIEENVALRPALIRFRLTRMNEIYYVISILRTLDYSSKFKNRIGAAKIVERRIRMLGTTSFPQTTPLSNQQI